MGLVYNENQFSEDGSINGCRNSVHINYTKISGQYHDCNIAVTNQPGRIPVDKHMWVFDAVND
jgi:hypothetical protein